jgi:hypothetical protein
MAVRSAVAKIGATLVIVAMAMGGHATVVRMRRLVSGLVRAVIVIVVVAVVREILLDRTPEQALHGREPVLGSLDTWPAVPRRPEG